MANERIQKLIEEGRVFKGEEGKTLDRIFYSRSVGVILYFADKNSNGDIYLANDSKFFKCDSMLTGISRGGFMEADWNIRTQNGDCVLRFPLSRFSLNVDESFPPNPYWEKILLKQATL